MYLRFCLPFIFAFNSIIAQAQTTLQLPLNPGRINPGTDIKRLGNEDFLMSSYFPGTVIFDGGDANLTRFNLKDGVQWSKDFFFDFPNGGSYVTEWPQESALLMTAFVLDSFYNKVLVKLDQQGNVLWSRRYGKPKDVSEVGLYNGKTLATPLADGNVLLAGGASAIFSNADDNDLFVGKIDPNGDIIWARNLCFSCLGDVDAAFGSAILTADGGFLITGIVERNNAQNNEDVLLVKLTANGDLQWAKSYNSAGSFFANDDRGFEVKALPNGHFVIVGALENFVNNLSDGLLLEVEENGNFVRSVAVKISNSDHTVSLLHLEVLDNNTVVFSGSTSQDTLSTAAVELNLLGRVGLDGSLNWSRNFYTEPLVGYGTAPNSLLRLPSGGYGYLLNYALNFDFLYPILVLTDENGQTGCEEAVSLSTQTNLVFSASNLPLTTESLSYAEDFPMNTVDFAGFNIALPYPDLGPDQTLCAPFNVQLDAQKPGLDAYAWSTGENAPAITIDQPGSYAITVTSNAFCFTAADTVVVAVSTAAPSVVIGVDTAGFCANGIVRLIATAMDSDTFLWSTNDATATIEVDQAGLFSLVVSNACGTAEEQIVVELPVCDSAGFCPLLVPNAFSTNNDGFNDQFLPVGNCRELQGYLFRVYSRWGELVFEAEEQQKGWDGRINGQPAASDVYGWRLQYKKSGGEAIQEKGGVTLLR